MRKSDNRTVVMDLSKSSLGSLLFCHDTAVSERTEVMAMANSIVDYLIPQDSSMESLQKLEKTVESVKPTSVFLQRIYRREAELDNGKTRYRLRKDEMIRQKQDMSVKLNRAYPNDRDVDFQDLFSFYRECLIKIEKYHHEFPFAYQVFNTVLSSLESRLPTLVGKPNPLAEEFQLEGLATLALQYNRPELLEKTLGVAEQSKSPYAKRLCELRLAKTK